MQKPAMIDASDTRHAHHPADHPRCWSALRFPNSTAARCYVYHDRSVVEFGNLERPIFLTPFALPMTAQIKAQRCDADIGQPGRQSSKEAALLPCHTPPCTKTAA
jgi:hypothetical protein